MLRKTVSFHLTRENFNKLSESYFSFNIRTNMFNYVLNFSSFVFLGERESLPAVSSLIKFIHQLGLVKSQVGNLRIYRGGRLGGRASWTVVIFCLQPGSASVRSCVRNRVPGNDPALSCHVGTPSNDLGCYVKFLSWIEYAY